MFTDKSKCIDMFQKFELDGEKIYEVQNVIGMMAYKMRRRFILQQLSKIRFIKTFKILKGELYNFILLKIIDLERELFVIDVE